MIFAGTILSVCDNSGVKWVQCLKILGKRPKAFGKPGDIIVISVKKVKSLSKIKKKDIYKAIIDLIDVISYFLVYMNTSF